MAFRPLTDADCGAPNALVQLTSHLTKDHAFKETQGHAFPTSSDQLVEQFLRETQPIPQSFHMNDLMREMHEIESQRANLPPVPASAIKDHLHDNEWALQYIEDGGHFNENRDHEAVWAEITAHEQQHNAILESHHNVPLQNDILSWEEQFFRDESEEALAARDSANVLLEEEDEPQAAYSKFMKFMKSVGDGDTTIDGGEVFGDEAAAWSSDYLNTLQKEDSRLYEPPQVEKDETYNSLFWEKLQDEWKKLSAQDADHPWLNEYSETYNDVYKEYTFSEDNPMFDVANPLERGKQLLQQGDLPSAVLCFEAAVKKETENAEAWQLLGTTQAENEQDPNAICALKRCLELDSTNSTALMALAASYTNESYPRQACQALLAWMQAHPEYGRLVPPDLQLHGNEMQIMTDLFLKAAQQRPQNVDYEVQCGLGVLFNLSSEYIKAADCFRAALSVKPDDAKLWNRLGATLANGNKPEEAVEAYHRALNLEPGYIRARYNVGIACINLGAYNEAAEHFLLALNQQARGKDMAGSSGSSQMSDTIWSTLRMCVSLMNRPEVREAVDARDLPTLNQTFNIHD